MAPNRQSAQRFWGREFARAREARGLTQDSLAERVFVSSSLIALWETGRRTPRSDDLARCEEVLDTNGFLSRLLAELVAREVAHEWLDRWIEVESRATTLLSFQSTVIDGLLQTPDYARAVLGDEDLVRVRLERQRVLEEGDPPMYVVVLPEYVLRQRIGGAEVMRAQLKHLAAMARRPTVAVQIVPPDAAACAKFLGPFVVASLAGGEVAYVDNQFRGEVVEQPDAVAGLRRTFESFRADALSGQQSIALIERTAEQWTT